MNVPATRVLVADDEPSIRYVLRETLEDLGCQVTEVEDGDAAGAALATGDFELAFLDIRMPGPSGLELLERDGIPESSSIVIITAQNTFENAVEAMKRGAFDYLVKPFGMAEVEALVARRGVRRSSSARCASCGVRSGAVSRRPGSWSARARRCSRSSRPSAASRAVTCRCS